MPVEVEPEADLLQAYNAFVVEARNAILAAREQGINLRSSVIQAMLSYSAAPWRVTEIRDRTGQVWAFAPDLEVVCRHCGRILFKNRTCQTCHPKRTPRACLAQGCGEKRPRVFNKERALLDRLIEAKSRNRPALVLVLHTDTLDIVSPRWIGPNGLCASVGIHAIDGGVFSASQRARKLENAALAGADVVFVHPLRIETSINLTSYPEIHHYQLSYDYLTVAQVSARSHGPTQTQPVSVHYYATTNTYEARALGSLAAKMQAAMIFQGDSGESALAGRVGTRGADLLHQIIADVSAADVIDLSDQFAQVNAAAAELLWASDPDTPYTVEQRNQIEERLEALLAPEPDLLLSEQMPLFG